MSTADFTFTLLTDQTPQQVFKAITNVRAWWSGYHAENVEGGTEQQGDEFTFSAADGLHVTRQKLVEVIPDRRVVWLVTHSALNYLQQPAEWTGTRVRFDIAEKGGQTELVFTHEGLTPDIECYDSCAPSWTQYLQNKLAPMIGAS
ncbi:SRPBCC family protein [Paraflavitalea pollutisoli]|uniref:SRPBCC family protein n=1 Tax=Paraflavitalea pollutisoli TaxID=3034143 RepID=UPI0023EAAF27|nr:SRPBCC domain-containing protein [Paraflavitalea sp. H1-2-19X]